MTLAQFTIRRATTADAGPLTTLGLASKAHWGYDADFMARSRAELTITPARLATETVFVAERDGRPIGYYSLDLTAPDMAEVAALFVEPSQIGRGVGAALFRHLTNQAHRAGVKQLTIDSDPNAAGFYARMGCVRAGESPSASIPGRRLPRFVIALADA